MKLPFFLIIPVVFFASCSGDKPAGENLKQNKPAKDTGKIELHAVEKPSLQSLMTPEQFRDYLLEALKYNNPKMVDNITHTREDLEMAMRSSDSSEWAGKKYQDFIDNLEVMVKEKTKNGFEDMVKYGMLNGIDWGSPAGFSKRKKKGLFPGYDIGLLFKGHKSGHRLRIQIDSVSRGFVMGAKKIEMVKVAALIAAGQNTGQLKVPA